MNTTPHPAAKDGAMALPVILSRRSATKDLKMRMPAILRSFAVFAAQDDDEGRLP
jgi:hypothetical protein